MSEKKQPLSPKDMEALTPEERRRLINESGEVLPGDQQRAKDEPLHEDDALDSGTSIGTTEGAEAGLDDRDRKR